MVGLLKVKNGQQKDMTYDEIRLRVDTYQCSGSFWA